MEVLKINGDLWKKEISESDIPVLIDFNAEWCGPCRMLEPVLEDLAKETKDVKIVSVNVDENEELVAKYNVFSIPCLVLMKENQEIKRRVGFASKEEIQKFIED